MDKILDEKSFLKKLIDTNHPSGGLIISKNSKTGFCDTSQKIWNIKNAYVNGPCIFPNSSYANVGLNTLAFTKLLAQKLKTILLNN